MSTQRTRRIRSRSPVATRASYARTSGDMLTGGWDPAAGINPSDQSPVIWWNGSDQLNGPIGPNGPWARGGGSALSVTTRATSLICGPLTSAPFRTVDLVDGRPLGRPRWITDPMTIRNDARWPSNVYPDAVELPRSLFWGSLVRDSAWFGVGAFITQLDDIDQPLAGTLRLINPLLLDTTRDLDDGSLRWVLGSDGAPNDRAVFDRDGYLSLGPITYRIVTLRNPHSPVDSNGKSKGAFELSPSAFGLASQIETYATGTFRSGVPAGFLKVQTPNLSQTAADELRASWMAHHGGDRRSVGVLSSTIDFTPLNLSPVDTALGEVTRLNLASIAFAFGLDPDVLGAGLSNSSTYRNATEFWQRHRDFGLAPYQAILEDTLSALLPGSQGVRCDLDRFANPPLAERVTTGAAAVEAGLMTINEWRALEGMQPLGSSSSPEEQRSLSAAETSQKVYLAVTAGVLSVEEARQMIVDAGGKLDPSKIPVPAAPEPEPIAATGTDDPTPIRSARPQPWRR